LIKKYPNGVRKCYKKWLCVLRNSILIQNYELKILDHFRFMQFSNMLPIKYFV